jgi:hypothetical protein
VPTAWKKNVRHAAAQPNGIDVRSMGIMEFLPVKELLDREIIVERLVIPGRARRWDVHDVWQGYSLLMANWIEMEGWKVAVAAVDLMTVIWVRIARVLHARPCDFRSWCCPS